MVLKNGLSRMRGDSPVRFSGGGGAVMRCCYPTRCIRWTWKRGEIERRQLKRKVLVTFFAKQAPAVIAMEACGSAHYWARRFASLGHQVRLIAPSFVRPFVKSNKTDAADAQAIWEAAQRPGMRFVAVKSEAQQAVLSLHRVREQLVRMRRMQINQMHGLLLEFGVALRGGAHGMGDATRALCGKLTMRREFGDLVDGLGGGLGCDRGLRSTTQRRGKRAVVTGARPTLAGRLYGATIEDDRTGLSATAPCHAYHRAQVAHHALEAARRNPTLHLLVDQFPTGGKSLDNKRHGAPARTIQRSAFNVSRRS
ncbi:hypothetical protein OKW49_008052 [Paraburkholderia youngii]